MFGAKRRLIAQAGPEEKDVEMRRLAIATLGAVWGKEDWLKDLLVPLTQPQEKESDVRCGAIGTLSAVWGKEEWLKELLTPLAGTEEKDDEVRNEARLFLKKRPSAPK